MPVEIAGTLSTFGPQVLSTKSTNERTKFGTSGRTERMAEEQFQFKLLGTTSLGVDTNVQSGFGHQVTSKAMTAPSHRFGNKYNSDNDMAKEGRPGPGTYEATSSMGKQTLSPNANLPAWKVSTGNRFSTYKNIWKEDFQTPAAQDWRPESGWLGDAPKYSFHGQGKRADVSRGLPGNKPSNLDDPGPGSYEPASSLGAQHDSRKANAWRTRVGTSHRDRITKSQYISPEHEKDLFGKHSPAPNLYNPTQSLAKTSRIQTPSSFRFGSGDRFSQVKPKETARKLPGFATPGPGSYVV